MAHENGIRGERRRRWPRRLALGLAAVVMLLAATVGGLLAFLGTDAGRSWLAATIEGAASDPQGLRVRIEGLDGHPLDALAIARITLADPEGDWLVVEGARLDWAPSALLGRLLRVDLLAADRIHVRRQPALPADPDAEPGAPLGDPLARLPVAIELGALRVDRLVLDEPVVGTPVMAGIEATATARPDRARLGLAIERADGVPGRLDARLDYRPAANLFMLDVTGAEPEGGVLARLLDLPGLPAMSVRVAGDGPLASWHGDAALEAGGETLLASAIRVAGSEERLSLGLDGYTRIDRLLPADTADLLGPRLDFSLAATMIEGSRLEIADLVLDAAPARIGASGAVDLDAGTVDATVRADRIDSDWIARMAPDVDVSEPRLVLHARGALASPRVELDAGAARITVAGTAVERVTLAAQADPTDAAMTEIAVDLALHAAGARLDDGTPIGEVTLDAAGLVDVAAARLRLDTVALDGEGIRLAFAGDVGFDGPEVTGRVTAEVADLARLPAGVELPLDGPASLATHLAYAPDGLVLDDLELRTGFAQLAARIALDGAFERLDARIARLDVELAPLSGLAGTPLAGRLAAEGTFGGALGDPEADLRLTGTDLAVDGRPLGRLTVGATSQTLASGPSGRLEATLAAPEGTVRLATRFAHRAEAIALDDVDLRLPGARVSGSLRAPLAAGAVTGELRVAGDDLGQALAIAGIDGSGRLDGRIRLDDARGSQRVAADLALADFVLRMDEGEPVTLAEATLAASATLAGDTPISARLRASGLAAAPLAAETITLSADGSLAQARLALELGGAIDLDQRQPVELRLVADLAAAETTAIRIVEGDGRFAREPFTLARGAEITLGVEGEQVSGFGIAGAFGRLALDAARRGEALDGTLTVSEGDLEALGRLVPGIDATGSFQVRATLAGTTARPTGRLALELAEVRSPEVEDAPPLDLTVAAVLDPERLTLDAAAGGFAEDPLRLNATLGRRGEYGPLGFGDASPLTFGLRWRGNIAPLMAVAPIDEHRVTGNAEVTLGLGGTLGGPRASGEIVLADGSYEHLEHGTRLRFARLAIRGEGRELVLEPFEADDGAGGRLTANGRIVLDTDAGTPLEVTVELAQARLVRRDEVTGALSGRLEVTGTVTEMDVHGRFRTDGVEIDIGRDLPPSVVSLDVREIGRRPGAPEQPEPEPEPRQREEAGVIRLDIEVDMPDRVFVRGRGLDSEWQGRVTVTGTAAAPRIAGLIQSRRGRLDFAGKAFTVQPSRIRISERAAGGVEAVLDINAETRQRDLTVLVSVTGPADEPAIALSSIPELPDDEVLSRLLFDRSAGALSPLEAAMLARSLSTLRGGGGGGGLLAFDPITEIRQAVGLDVLRVDMAEGSGPVVETGRYLADGVFVGVRQGAAAGTGSVVVEIELFDTVTVDSRVKPDGSNDVGVKFRWNY